MNGSVEPRRSSIIGEVEGDSRSSPPREALSGWREEQAGLGETLKGWRRFCCGETPSGLDRVCAVVLHSGLGRCAALGRTWLGLGSGSGLGLGLGLGLAGPHG